MIIDNSVGLQYLFNDDIYLLKQDMDNVGTGHINSSAEPLIEVKTLQPAIVAEPPALYFNHLGSNAAQFLIMCSYAGAEQMDEKHLTALTSALQRKELTLADVAILNLAKHPEATITQLNEYYKPNRLLLLGAACLVAGWDKLAFNKLENLGGITALYTYSFTEMMGDRDKTKAFWEQMKVL